jgi:hypothetical protein
MRVGSRKAAFGGPNWQFRGTWVGYGSYCTKVFFSLNLIGIYLEE